MKYPFEKQRDLKDCGVCCLLMLTRYFGGSVSKEYLRELTNTNTNGTNAYNLIEAAKQLGFDSIGVKGNINNLNSNNLPCIAHVIYKKSYQHFIVIYKIDKKKKRLLIADPNNNSIKNLSFDEFDRISSGNFILLKPNKRIMYTDTNNELKNFLLNKLITNKQSIIKIIVLSFLITIIQILLSFDFKLVMNTGLETHSINNLLFLGIILILVVILKEISNFTRCKYINLLNHNLDISMFTKVYNHILSLPYFYYKNRTTGEITARISDLTSIRDVISKCIITCFIDLILIVSAIITLCLISFKLTIIVILTMLFILLVILFFNKPLDYQILKAKSNAGKLNSYLVETINGIETIKNQNIVPFIKKRFLIKYSKYNINSYKYNNLFIIFTFIKDLFIEIANILVLILGSYLVINNNLDLASLITFTMLNSYVFTPLNTISDLLLSLKEAKVAYNRIKELYEIEEEKDNTKYKKITGNIVIKNLSYSYNVKDLFLKNINLSIKKGQRILIYGKSGSGKSTLAKILNGELKIENKYLYYDDRDINRYSKSNIRKDICYISSKDTIFTDTVYNNIILDKEEDNTFDKVVKLCLVDEFIEDKNLAYDTPLEEDGFNLSGGQKQRIVLARSLLKDSNIYILDEALNQVDIEKERTILNNIFKAYPNKTFIYISHRFNNNDLFDKKYRIEDGVSYEECI